jgi:hypothetical protein
MADKLQILIEAILGKTTKQELMQELKNIEKGLKPIEIKANVDKISKQFQVMADGSKELQKITTEATNQLGQQVKTIENIGGKTQEVVATNFKAQKKALIEISDMSRKLTFEENQNRLKQVTKTQNDIERFITQSNETIAQRNMRSEMLNIDPTQYEKLWQKLLYEQDERLIKQKQETAEIEKQLALYKQQLAIKNQNLKTTYGKSYDSAGMSSILNSTNNLKASDFKTLDELKDKTKQIDLQVNKATAGMKQLRKEATLAMKESDSFMTTIVKDFGKMIAWSMVGTAIFGTLRIFKQSIVVMKEVETQLTSINRVMEDTTFSMKRFGESLFNITKQSGSTFQEASDVALRFAQAGYDVNETLKLTEISLMAVQTAELNAKNATESLIGIMSQWGLQVSAMPLLLDKINYISDQYTITSQDLVDGLLRSSSAARNLGVSIDETISLLTVMREVSGRTGREVGNALNSILSYISSPKALNVLEGAGIKIFTDSNKTEFRNFMDILGDVSQKWNGLSADIQDGFIKSAEEAGLFNEDLANSLNLQEQWNDVQRRDVSFAAAGTYRRNYFIALMEGFTRTKDVLKDLNNAEGYTLTEMEKRLKTLDTRFKIFVTTLKEVAVNMGNNGALDLAKEFVNLGTVLVGVIDKIGVLSTAIGGLIIYFTFFKTNMLFTPIINAATVAISGLTKGLNLTTLSAIKLNTVLGMFAPLAIAAGIWAIVKVLDATIVNLEEQIEKVNTLKNSISNLQSEYDKLSANNNRTEEEQKYLDLLQKELDLQKANLKTETERLVKQKYFKGSTTNTGGVTGIGSIDESIYGSGQSGEIKQYIADLNRLRKELSSSDSLEDSKGIQEKINSIELSLIASRKEIKEYIDVLGTDAPPALLSLANAIDEIILVEDNQTDSTNNATDAINEEIKSYEEFVKLLTDSQNKIADIDKALKEYNENSSFSSETLNSLIKQYPQLIQYLGNEQILRQELLNIIESESNVQAQNYVDMLQNSEDFYNRVLEGQNLLSNGLNKAYGIDLNNYKTLAEAKFDIEKKLLSGFGDMWRDYYNVQSGQMTANISELSRLAAMNDPQAKALLERIRLASQTTKRLNDFTLGLAKTDLGKINISKDKSQTSSSGSTTSDLEKPYEKQYQTIKNLNYELDRQNEILSQKEDLDKIPILTERNKLLDQQKKNLNDINNARREELAKLKPTSDRYQELKGLIQDTSLEWWKLDNAQLANLDTIKKINEEQDKLSLESLKSQQDLYKQQKESIQEVIDLTEKMIKQQKEDEIDALEEEVKAYEEIINAKKEALKLTEEQRDYEKDISEKQKDISTIQNRLLELGLDDSRESLAEKLKLEEELAKLTTDLEERQHDRSVQLQEDALDKELEQFKDTKEEEIDAIRDYLNKSGQLTADAMALINSQSDSVYVNLVKWNEQYGTSIEQDISTAWDKAKSALQSYKTELGAINVENAFNEIDEDSVVTQMKMNSLAWTTASESEKKRLHDENEELAKLIGAIYKKDGHWYKGGIKLYHEGIDSGFVGGLPLLKNNEEFAKLLKGELIINPIQMNRFMTNTLPQLTSMNNGFKIDKLVDITVQGNLDSSVIPKIDDIVNKAVDKLVNATSMRGMNRNVKTISI